MEVVGFIQVYVMEITQIYLRSEPSISYSLNFWSPPLTGLFKANFDTSFSAPNGDANAGMIIRNHERLIMGSCSYTLGRVGDSTMAEALVCLQANRFGEDLGLRALVVERDSLTIIKRINSVDEDRSAIGNIVKKIKKM